MKAKDLHYKTTGKQRKYMCRKGEFKPLMERGKLCAPMGEGRYESQADDLYSQAASTQLGRSWRNLEPEPELQLLIGSVGGCPLCVWKKEI